MAAILLWSQCSYPVISPWFQVFLKDGTSVLLDTSNENQCNWLCLIRAATTEANLIAVQLGTDIFYIAKQQIEPEEELTVWYAPHYARKLGKDPHPNGTTQGMWRW